MIRIRRALWATSVLDSLKRWLLLFKSIKSSPLLFLSFIKPRVWALLGASGDQTALPAFYSQSPRCRIKRGHSFLELFGAYLRLCSLFSMSCFIFFRSLSESILSSQTGPQTCENLGFSKTNPDIFAENDVFDPRMV